MVLSDILEAVHGRLQHRAASMIRAGRGYLSKSQLQYVLPIPSEADHKRSTQRGIGWQGSNTCEENAACCFSEVDGIQLLALCRIRQSGTGSLADGMDRYTGLHAGSLPVRIIIWHPSHRLTARKLGSGLFSLASIRMECELSIRTFGVSNCPLTLAEE